MKRNPASMWSAEDRFIILSRQLHLDLAKVDSDINKRTIQLSVKYVQESKSQHDIAKLTMVLGEEDINLPLLVAVENAIRTKFPDTHITLSRQIKETLEIYLKKSIASVNEGLSAYQKENGGELLQLIQASLTPSKKLEKR